MRRTESDDVAEARDVVDTIVAIDRADVPAVTVRRALAQRQREHEFPPMTRATPRCAIPEWFPTLVVATSTTPRNILPPTEQVSADIARGYRYHHADASGRIVESASHFRLPDEDRSALCSKEAIEIWAGAPLNIVPELSEGCELFTLDWWRAQWTLETEDHPITPFLVRRERRLNASLPDC